MESQISHIKVDLKLKGAVRQLEFLYRSKGVSIDWKKVRSVMTYSPKAPWLGIYNTRTKRIFIHTKNIAQDYPSDGLYKKILLLVLAHEVAHSQGLGHVKDPLSIMNDSAWFLEYLLEDQRLTDLLLQPYASGKAGPFGPGGLKP